MWLICSVLRVASHAMLRGGAACALLVLASGAMLGEPLDASADGYPCPSPPANCTVDFEDMTGECFYKSNDNKGQVEHFRIEIQVKTTIKLFCFDGTTLNNSSLPRFLSTTKFLNAVFDNCPLPPTSYAHIFEHLNILVEDALFLKNVPLGELRAYHFFELGTLSQLEVEAKQNNVIKVNKSDVTLFNSLSKLTELNLVNVALPDGVKAIEGLKNLTKLSLIYCSLMAMQLNQLCNLPYLNKLIIIDKTIKRISSDVLCNFTDVTLIAQSLRYAPSFPFATKLMLKAAIHKMENCSALENLTVDNQVLKTLPSNWLERCSRLKRLKLRTPQLHGMLSASALPNANTLQELEITSTRLSDLSDDLFNSNRNLIVLNLSHNKLTYLSQGVFSNLNNLRQLDLSNNKLTSSAVTSLASLKQLQVLKLANNKLGDLCDSGSKNHYARSQSKLSNLKELRELSLASTGAPHICYDWHHQLRNLEKLSLESNNITTLEWRDLNDWNGKITVRLKYNHLNFIKMSRKDYKDFIEDDKQKIFATTFITGNTILRCDCKMYWLATALRQTWFPVTFETLECEGAFPRQKLKDAPLDQMVCAENKRCPANCTCLWRPSNDSALIDCSSRGLRVFPDLSTIDWAWVTNETVAELRVRNNSISALPEALPPRLTVLDARDNNLDGDERALRVLLAHGRRVHLAGNRLDCSCSQPLLLNLTAAVYTGRPFKQIMDLDSTICYDGQSVLAAVRTKCSAGGVGGAESARSAVLWGSLGGLVGALLVAGGAALALRRNVRLRLKAILLSRGFCLRWARPDDDDHCKYDAFLSYAHEDEGVALELLAALEEGPAPLRLCVHHRDWQPGEWILGQIAKSVKESRRTIILLSENFAKSSWARAEFREAYAHALREDAVRLIVVVLGAAPPHDLDDDIRHYVSHNTYVRWGEPAFWEKLRVALPPGRPRAKPPRRQARAPPKKTRTNPPPPAQAKPMPTSPPPQAKPTPTSPPPQAKPTPTLLPTPAQAKPAPTSQSPSARVKPTPTPSPTPAPPRRPPPLRTDLPVHPAPPRPSTPIVKFGQINFSDSLKPAKSAAPPCA